jgi:hypothetical protein
LPAIAEFSLANYPVCQINPGDMNEEYDPASTVTASHRVVNDPPRYNYWPQWVHLTALDLAEVVPPLSTCILVDGVQLGDLPVYNRLFLPFLERDGQYYGSPADSRQAIAGLERLRVRGATHIAIAWTAFWWLDSYGDFFQYLRSRYPCRLENERVIIFDLQLQATA